MADDFNLGKIFATISIEGLDLAVRNLNLFEQKVKSIDVTKLEKDLNRVNKELKELQANLARIPNQNIAVRLQVSNVVEIGKVVEEQLSKIKAPGIMSAVLGEFAGLVFAIEPAIKSVAKSVGATVGAELRTAVQQGLTSGLAAAAGSLRQGVAAVAAPAVTPAAAAVAVGRPIPVATAVPPATTTILPPAGAPAAAAGVPNLGMALLSTGIAPGTQVPPGVQTMLPILQNLTEQGIPGQATLAMAAERVAAARQGIEVLPPAQPGGPPVFGGSAAGALPFGVPITPPIPTPPELPVARLLDEPVAPSAARSTRPRGRTKEELAAAAERAMAERIDAAEFGEGVAGKTVDELRAEASRLNIAGRSKVTKKADLQALVGGALGAIAGSTPIVQGGLPPPAALAPPGAPVAFVGPPVLPPGGGGGGGGFGGFGNFGLPPLGGGGGGGGGWLDGIISKTKDWSVLLVKVAAMDLKMIATAAYNVAEIFDKAIFKKIDFTNLTKLGEMLEGIGKKAAISFGIGTAALTKFIKAADPIGFSFLQGTLGELFVQIGSIFLPLMDSFHAAVGKLRDFFRGLDDATKDQIANFTLFAGGLLAIGAAIPLVTRSVLLLRGAIQALGLVIGFASGGLVPLVSTIIGAALAVGLFKEASESAGGGIAGAFAGVGKLFSAIGTILKPLITVFNLLADVVGTILVQAFEALKGPVGWIATTLEFLVKVIATVIAEIIGLVELAKDLLTGNWKNAGEKTKKAVKEIWQGKQEQEERLAAGRHTPIVAGKVDVISITDLWRRAQASGFETPDQRMAQERTRLAADANKKLGNIDENIKKIAGKKGVKGGIELGD